jgi:2-amino-4-hydroxy-6-hydroxymethyldihydropteridine diphosphokinase
LQPIGDNARGDDTPHGSFRNGIVALGGNLPLDGRSPAETLRAAVATLSDRGVEVTARSHLYRTPAFPPGSGPDFANAVVQVRTASSAETVLTLLHEIEAAFGRVRDQRWGPRSLDLDLIALGDVILPDADTHAEWRALPPDAQGSRVPDRLILPHPRVQDRAFVLIPLSDAVPDWHHPVTGQSVAEMVAALPEADRQSVIALDQRV